MKRRLNFKNAKEKDLFRFACDLVNNSKIKKYPLELPNYLGKNSLKSQKNRLERSSLTYVKYFESVKNICSMLKKEKIKFVIIKSLKAFDYVDSNLDIVLIDKGDLHKCKKFLSEKRHKFKTIFREPNKIMASSKDFLIKFHLHKEIAWNGLVFFDKNIVFKRSKNWEGIPITSDEDDLLINCAHLFFENYIMTLSDFLQLRALVKKNLDWNYILSRAKFYGWEIVLKKVLSDFNYVNTSIFPKEKARIPRNLLINSNLKNITFPLKYGFFDNLYHLYRRLKMGPKRISLISYFWEIIKGILFYVSAKTVRPYLK